MGSALALKIGLHEYESLHATTGSTKIVPEFVVQATQILLAGGRFLNLIHSLLINQSPLDHTTSTATVDTLNNSLFKQAIQNKIVVMRLYASQAS